MEAQEGVIKYQLHYTKTNALDNKYIQEINAWRYILYLTQLIGQDINRYQGYGYGNISRRFENNSFIISGSQTGHLEKLTHHHYALITDCSIDNNTITAEGATKPSSEALTHAMIYQLDNNIQCVMHAHSPIIWQNMQTLNLPFTQANIAYGTPAMAIAIKHLFQETHLKTVKILAMAGHEDGIISFGNTTEEAGNIMLNYLAKALQLI